MNESSNFYPPRTAQEAGRDRRPFHILLVDDDEDDYIIVRGLLAEIGAWKFELKWVATYETALEAIQRYLYDVCLIDYRLGAHSGLEFLRQASGINRRVPMILLTGQGGHEIDVEAMRAGAADFLVKGQIDAALLERSIRYAVEHARLYREVQEYGQQLIEINRSLAEINRNLEAEIAEHKQTEEALRRAHDDLKETNAELESFTYSVSHDLRAPLRAMQGFADALQEDYADRLDLTGQDYAWRIVTAARRMDTLIQDLLTYSRLSRADLRLHRIGLRGVAKDVLVQMEEEFRERNVQVTVQGPLPEVVGHRATLAQVLTNLLTNAVKFVNPDTPPRVRIWAEERDGWVRLCVEDNGIGIAPEHYERIFRVFERLHGVEAYPGTGIGLAIVRKGGERMGGRVGVESEVGRGSRFWVELLKPEDKP